MGHLSLALILNYLVLDEILSYPLDLEKHLTIDYKRVPKFMLIRRGSCFVSFPILCIFMYLYTPIAGIPRVIQ